MSAVIQHQEQLPTLEPATLLQVISRAASDPNVDVDKMERLMAMHERMVAKQAEAAFNTAMTACQKEMPRVLRNKTNSDNGSKFADLEQLDRIARPIYTGHGFSLSFGTTDCPLPGHYRVTCLVSHVAGHSRNYQADIPLDNVGLKGNPNKTGVQGYGSTMSYGQRYMTKLIFNIALRNEDKDGNDPNEPKLSEQQVADLKAVLTEVSADIPKFLRYIKCDKLEDIYARNYDYVLGLAKAKRKQQK